MARSPTTERPPTTEARSTERRSPHRLSGAEALPPAARTLPPLSQAALLAACLVAIVVLFLPLTPMYDFDVFLHAGEMLLQGRSVYPNPSSPAVYSGSAFVYPYLASWPFALYALLPAASARALFFLTGSAAVIAATMIAGRREAITTALVLATAFTITGLQLGALSPLLLAGVVVLWALRDRPLAFGVCAAAVVASKLFLAPILLWPLLAGRRRAFAWAFVLTVAVIGLGFLLGPLGPIGYLHLLVALARHESKTGFSVMGALKSTFKLASLPAEAIAAGLATVMLAGSQLLFRRTRREQALFSGGVLASLAATPILWSHYLALLIAILIVCGARRRWFLALVLASWVIAPPHGI